MSARTAKGARVVAAVGVIAGACLAGTGLLNLVSAGDQSGLAKMGTALVGLGLIILGSIPLAVGLAAWRASIVLVREPAPGSRDHALVLGDGGTEPVRRASSRALTAVVLIVAVAWLSPAIAALVVVAVTGAWALSSGTDIVVLSALGVGAVVVAGAWVARALPDRPIRQVLVLLVLASAIVPAWETAVIAPSLNPPWYVRQSAELRQSTQDAERAEQERFRERYADILDGPTLDDLAARLATIGSWRLASIGMGPDGTSCGSSSGCSGASGRSLPFWERVGELGGGPVRFLLVGQCWVEDDAGRLISRVISPEGAWPHTELEISSCDGAVQVAVSAPVQLPSWAPEEVQAMRARDQSFVILGSFADDRDAAPGLPEERAERWAIFVSPDPPEPPEDVRDAFLRETGTLEIR